MSWHFLQEQEEASWEASSLDGAPSALSSLIPTAAGSCSPDSGTDSCRDSRSGTTSPRLTESRGGGGSMWSAGGSHAPTLVPPGAGLELRASSLPCGKTWRALSVKFDLASSSWKTAHCLLSEDLPWSSVTLPKWGMMRAGELWERTTLVLPTSGTGVGLWHTPRANECSEKSETFVKRNADRGAHCFSGLSAQVKAMPKMWPTPTTIDNPQVAGQGRAANHPKRGTTLGGAVRAWGTPRASDGMSGKLRSLTAHHDCKSRLEDQVAQTEGSGGHLNPNWVEWLMGWPIGFTASEPLATDKFRQWCDSHGISWEAGDEG
jgi:hypothetical protein